MTNIACEIGVDASYVKDSTMWLLKVGLISKNRNNVRAKVIILSKDETAECIKLARKICAKEAQLIASEKPVLMKLVSRLGGDRWQWNSMEPILICAWIADNGVNSSLHRSGVYPKPPERYLTIKRRGKWPLGRYYFFGMEGGTQAKRHIGVNLYNGVGYLHSSFVRKPSSAFSDMDQEILRLVQHNMVTIRELQAHLSESDRGQLPKIIKEFKKVGVVEDKNGVLSPRYPYFSESEITELTSLTQLISERIIREAVMPLVPLARKLFNEIRNPSWEWGAFLCLLIHLSMDHSTDELVSRGVINEFPRQTDAAWGMWGFSGKMSF